MYTKVLSSDLKVGMFVSDLDRPWIDTPFPLQGFLIEDQQQIAQLQRYCAYVMVDRTRSTGDEYQAAPYVKQGAPGKRILDSQARVVVHSRVEPGAKTSPEIAPPKRGQRGTPQAPVSNRDMGFRPVQSGRLDLSTETPDNTPGAQTDASTKASLWKSLLEGVRGFFNTGIASASARERFDDDLYLGMDPDRPKDNARHEFLPETVQITYYTDAHSVEEEIATASEAYERSSAALHHLVQDIRIGKNLAIVEVEEVIGDMVDSMVRNPDALMWVARMREQDMATYGHGLQVAVYLIAFGRHLGFPKDYLEHLGMLGILLDIGKLKLPRELLEKNAHLSDAEFATVQEHVRLGLDILAQTPNLHADVLEGIAQHHERENGSGYPAGLTAEKISIFGRMSAIADCFAALTNKRPYAEAVSTYLALRSLSEWGGDYFHAPLVEQFIQAVGVFPVGSLVELSSGEVAIIVSHNKVRRLKPRVLVISGPDKSPSPHPAVLDLLYDPKIVGETPIYIRRGLPAGAYGLDTSEFYPA